MRPMAYNFSSPVEKMLFQAYCYANWESIGLAITELYNHMRDANYTADEKLKEHRLFEAKLLSDFRKKD